MTRDSEAPRLLTAEAVLFCPSCGANFPPSGGNFAAYLVAGGEQKCQTCEVPIDWWKLVVDALTSGFLGLQYAPIRARFTHAETVMTPGEQTAVDLRELGVPSTARILYVNYTPARTEPPAAEGVLVPLEVHTNTPHRCLVPDRPLVLFPMPIGGVPPRRQTVGLLIVWIDKGSLGVADASLMTAVEALNSDRHQDAVVPAAAAVEVSVEPVLSAFLERFAERRAVTRLLRGAGLAGQLEVLLGTVAGVVAAPPLPTPPADALGKLRTLRNRAAHDGALPAGTTREQVAEAVAGSIFAIEHSRLVAHRVQRYFKQSN